MKTIQRIKLALLTTLALALSLGLVACSEDTPTAPAASTPPASLDEVWQQELDAIAATDGGPGLLADLAPQLEEARAKLDDTALKHGGRLFVALQRSTFEVVPPPPPPAIHLHIYYEGVGTVLGRHTGFSDSYTDITVVPPVQTTVTTFTDRNDDELVLDTTGGGEVDEESGMLLIEGEGAVTGGTGRYENAGGNAIYYGVIDEAASTGRVLWVGWIHLNG